MDRKARPGPAPPTRSPLRPYRLVLFVLAWIFLAVGIMGVFLPLVPGTLFLILAGACFTRSSPRFEAWLLDHPRFGPPVRAWRETGAIPRRGKLFAGASLALSWLIIVLTDASGFVSALTFAVFLAVGLYIATRPEH
ncbi:MAG: YbaN family protein [Pseudomonadota bacterium]|nr:YbaN family protein [Pseudomonadota bacterium]